MRTGLMAFLMLPKAARPNSSRRHLSASSAGFSFSFSGAWRGEGDRLWEHTATWVKDGRQGQESGFVHAWGSALHPRKQRQWDGREFDVGHGGMSQLSDIKRAQKPRVEEDCVRRDNIFPEILKVRPNAPPWDEQRPEPRGPREAQTTSVPVSLKL